MKLTENVLNMYADACAQPQSNYALQHLVDGGQLTPERRFRQAVIELTASQHSLREAEYNLATKRIELEEAQYEYSNISAQTDMPSLQFKKRKLDLDIAKLESDIHLLERGLYGKRREMNVHLNMLQQYQDELGFDEKTTIEEVEERLEAAERDHYVTKLALDAAAQFVASHGGPTQGITLAFQQLPKEDVSRVMAIVEKAIPQMMETKYIEALHSPDGIKVLEDPKAVLQAIAK